MAASGMQRADVTEPGTRGRLQRPEEGREEEGTGSGDTWRIRTVLWNEKHLAELSGISVFPPGDDKEGGHSRVAERNGKDDEALP